MIWVFITLPAICLIAGYLYVLLTMIEISRLGVPIWKEDALQTLANGLNDDIQTLPRSADESGAVRRWRKGRPRTEDRG